MDEFEELLQENRNVLERFVKFKISNYHDAEDIIQEIYLNALKKFGMLKNRDSFKAWIISIAKNKCNDYYRKKSQNMDIPLETLTESKFIVGCMGVTHGSIVTETLDLLGDKDKQILYLYFFKQLPQEEIAKKLNIPIGTVKSRLYYAKQNFKDKYPYQPKTKGENIMKQFPEIMPEYEIKQINKEPFDVEWEELMGWFLVPKLGEKFSWAMYDTPERRRTEIVDMQVVGRAEVHGIEGVEIEVQEHYFNRIGSIEENSEIKRNFIAQLTDTHCRYLAESHYENGVKKHYTFLDGDDFLDNWGFGEDNCGNEIHLTAKGDILRKENEIATKDKNFLIDIVGRYNVTINGKTYDTVCVIDCYTYNDGVVSEQFLDKNGKTILWRRFNKNDWAFSRYGKMWTEMLPQNETLIVNGETYVHWYDCITDYIL